MLMVIFKCPKPRMKYPRDFNSNVCPNTTRYVPNTLIGSTMFIDYFKPMKSGKGKKRAPRAKPIK